MKYFLKLLFIVVLLTSCETDFLDAVSDKNKVVPQSLEDFQAMLDNSGVMNDLSSHRLALIAVDEYEISDTRWGIVSSVIEKSAYHWQDYGNEDVHDWNYSYKRILYSNIVLEGLENLGQLDKDRNIRHNIQGAAHFFRAYSFFDLVQLFCKTYDANTARQDLGLPLKTVSDIERIPQRSSLQETYDLIIHDLKQAVRLLPDEQIIKERPTKLAAMSLLSRVFLYMNEYEKSLDLALDVLNERPNLLDYNSINLSARYPFPTRGIGNDEVIFMYRTGAPGILNTSSFNASEKFLSYYGNTDLRMKAFFFNNTDGRKLFKGSYGGTYQCFTGLATDELYLIAAECFIRLEEPEEALRYLNTLRKNRYTDHIDLVVSDFPTDRDILAVVLLERRKELYRRGLLWGDLKRLNHEGVFKETLKRTINGVVYELLPNDPRYVWPIPRQVVELSGVEQN